MRQLLGSTRGRLLTAAAAGALAALFVLLVNPFPTDVLGQTTPVQPASGQVGAGQTLTIGGVTFVNQGQQPCNVQVAGNQATIACPAGFTVQVQGAACSPVGGQTNVVVCTVAAGARVTFTTVAGVSRQATTPPVAAAPAPAPAARPAAPAVLPRTGTGAGDGGLTTSTLLAIGLLAIAAALGSGALVLGLRRARG